MKLECKFMLFFSRIYLKTSWGFKITEIAFLMAKLFTQRLHCCCGFIWDRVKFLPSSWCGAVFWIQDENSVDHTSIFQLLLNSVYTNSRTFLFFTLLCQQEGWEWAQEAGSGQNENSCSKLAKGILHTRWCHAEQQNGKELAGDWPLLRVWVGHQAVGGGHLRYTSLALFIVLLSLLFPLLFLSY